MSSTVAYSDTDVKQALLMSRLSGNPAQVQGDIFAWNGIVIDRPSAVVALLKIYSQLPVGTQAKTRLHEQYKTRFSESSFSLLTDDEKQSVDIWFYRLCKTIKGTVEQRSNDDIKQILISLHTT